MKWFDGYLESMQALAAGQLDGNSQTLNDTISFAGEAINGEVASNSHFDFKPDFRGIFSTKE
jgi:hypothetical protein